MMLLFIVNGEDVIVRLPEPVSLARTRNEALVKSRNTGRPSEEWEIRRETGRAIDPNLMTDELRPGERLFLSLRVGFGGAN